MHQAFNQDQLLENFLNETKKEREQEKNEMMIRYQILNDKCDAIIEKIKLRKLKEAA